MEKFYPDKISRRFASPAHAGVPAETDAEGRWANFLCGVSVGFRLRIDPAAKKIAAARFGTNGCGYVVAAADLLCERLEGMRLTELHGLAGLEEEVAAELGPFPDERLHCIATCFEALQNALAAYRAALVGEWTGEQALICTCFGVTEERIEEEIAAGGLTTVEEVGEACHAGTGCGSCQPLIRELLDAPDLRRG